MATIWREYRDKILLILLLVFLAGYRVLLIQTGQLYWPDEFRYLHALHFLDELKKGEFSAGLSWVFNTYVGTRPSFILFSMIPATLQGVAHLVLGVQPSDPVFYRIPGVVNVIVSLGIAALFYRIVLLLSGDRAIALLGVFTHGMLVNTNLYVRHLFPYDWSLLLLLAALVVALEPWLFDGAQYSRAVVAGFLGGMGFTTYPGYYAFILPLLAVFIVRPDMTWRHLVVLLGATLSVFVLWEAIAQLGGLSFWGSSLGFLSWVTTPSTEGVSFVQGSPEEAYRFFPLYLIEIEGAAGLVLALLFLYFWVPASAGRFGKTEVAMISAAMAGYLAYAIVATVTQSFAILGRLLHMYLPFVILAGLLALKSLYNSRMRQAVIGCVILASMVSFVFQAGSALALRYPREVEREVVASMSGAKICKRMSEGSGHANEPATDCDIVLDNFRHLYPLPHEVNALPPAGFVQTLTYDHPLQFAPYGFEGFSSEERERLVVSPPVMRVYVRGGRGAGIFSGSSENGRMDQRHIKRGGS